MINWQKSKFTKAIAISPEDHMFILLSKGRRSMAGRLEEIINYYKKNHPETNKMYEKNDPS